VNKPDTPIVMKSLSFFGHPVMPAGILACLGLILSSRLASLQGAGLSTDAVNYLAAAEHLAAGQGFTSFEGGPYVLWPPLYPILLAVPRVLFNADPLVFGAALNALAFAGIILLSGLLAARLLDSDRFLVSFTAAAALLMTGVFAVVVNIGSDPVFLVLMLLFFLLFEKFSRRNDQSLLAGMIFTCSLACLQRYVGVTLVLAGFLGILYVGRAELRRALVEASAFATLAVLPLLVWIVRNLIVSGTLLGVRDPSAWRLDENLQDLAFKVTHWFIPYQLASQPFFWVVLAGLMITLFIAYSRRGRRPSRPDAPRPITFVLAVFTAIYLSAVSGLTKSIDHKNTVYDDRMYLPVLFILIIFALLFIRRFVYPLIQEWNPPRGRIALYGVLLLWLIFPAYGTYKLWVRCINEDGIAYYNIYNTPAYRDSTVTQHLTPWATGPAATVYSNYPAAVYLATRRNARSLPNRTDFFGVLTPLDTYFGVWPGNSTAVLVWYEPNTKKNLYSVDELAALADMQPVFTSDDGSIYLIQAR
jgi:hypothetical protein